MSRKDNLLSFSTSIENDMLMAGIKVILKILQVIIRFEEYGNIIDITKISSKISSTKLV